MITFILSALTILVSYTVGTIASFGPTLLALPVLLLFNDIYFVRPMLTLYGLLFTIGVFFTIYKHINKRQFFLILMVAGTGLPLGVFMYSYLNREILLMLVGFFSLFVSIRGILRNVFNRAPHTLFPKWFLFIVLFLAGVMHGAFSTGGPLLLIYTSQNMPNKTEFRATQMATWLVFNTFLTLYLFVFSPTPLIADTPTLYAYLSTLPFLVLAVILGTYLEKKVSVKMFQRFIFIMLFIGAVSILMGVRSSLVSMSANLIHASTSLFSNIL